MAVLVPWYLLITRYLGLKNNILALILPMLFFCMEHDYCETFMKGIPASITESGTIDGATDFRIFFSLILPLSKPLLATLSLFSAIAYWNDWYNCMLFISMISCLLFSITCSECWEVHLQCVWLRKSRGMAMDSIPLSSMQMAMTVIANWTNYLVISIYTEIFC